MSVAGSLTRPAVAVPAAAMALAVGVYFLGLLLHDAAGFTFMTPAFRALLGLFVAAVAVFAWLLRRLRTAGRARLLEDSLKRSGQEQLDAARPDQRDLAAALDRRFREGLDALRSSRLGAGALYALPWYVIIGPPGSGKTTMLQRSGLTLLLDHKRGIRGLGGTRNCDWFFTREGILLDTAGRYTAQVEDHDEWLAFLDLLKTSRRQTALNGVIVAMSVGDLIESGEEELDGHAEKIRQRVDEICGELELALPVYLLLTKADLVQGFVEFFGGLDRPQRAQIWGATFDFQDERPADEQLAEELVPLQAQLERRRTRILALDAPLRRQQRIYSFPIQFERLRDRLLRFVEMIVQPNPYHEAARLRGVYFTSGTQEGSPIDQVMSKMRSELGFPIAAEAAEAAEESARGAYFIESLFRDVVFEDRNVATQSKVAQERTRRRRAIGMVASAAAALLVVALGWTSAARVVTETKEVRRTVDETPRIDTGADAKSQLGQAVKRVEHIGKIKIADRLVARGDAIEAAAQEKFEQLLDDPVKELAHNVIRRECKRLVDDAEKIEGDDPADISDLQRGSYKRLKEQLENIKDACRGGEYVKLAHLLPAPTTFGSAALSVADPKDILGIQKLALDDFNLEDLPEPQPPDTSLPPVASASPGDVAASTAPQPSPDELKKAERDRAKANAQIKLDNFLEVLADLLADLEPPEHPKSLYGALERPGGDLFEAWNAWVKAAGAACDPEPEDHTLSGFSKFHEKLWNISKDMTDWTMPPRGLFSEVTGEDGKPLSRLRNVGQKLEELRRSWKSTSGDFSDYRSVLWQAVEGDQNRLAFPEDALLDRIEHALRKRVRLAIEDRWKDFRKDLMEAAKLFPMNRSPSSNDITVDALMRFFDVPDGRFEVFLKDLGEAEAVLPWLYSSNAIKAIGDIRRFAEKIRRAIYHEADGTQRLYLDIRFTADPVSDSKQYEAGDGPYQHVEIRLVGGSNPWTWGTKARRTERDRALPWSFDAESAAIRFLPAPKVDSARHESAPPSVPYSQEGPWALLRLMASLGTPPTRRGAAIDYLIPVPGAKGTTPSDIGWRLSVTAPSDCTDWRGNPFDTDFFKPPVLPEDITLPEDIPPSKGN